MTEAKNYRAPINGSPMPLAASAGGAFKALLWVGLIAAVGWIIGGLVGMSTDSYDDPGQALGALAFSGMCLQVAIPFLVGAGLIAGLGKRAAAPTAKVDAEPASAAGAYAPVDES